MKNIAILAFAGAALVVASCSQQQQVTPPVNPIPQVQVVKGK
ncbi:hypothetical protein QET40_01610 [Akkermansia sp. N21169]|nr:MULTISPECIES: hypothetical protein [unclassified Akkermansia]MDH3067798.1 hypothetical protein [Akkermansia sp. N21169]WPX41086.1 hypothetical protein QET93_003085 [Akkermansia sp. N21116]